jgi:hypothetical protein
MALAGPASPPTAPKAKAAPVPARNSRRFVFPDLFSPPAIFSLPCKEGWAIVPVSIITPSEYIRMIHECFYVADHKKVLENQGIGIRMATCEKGIVCKLSQDLPFLYSCNPLYPLLLAWLSLHSIPLRKYPKPLKLWKMGLY